jgi:hypothetical protein
MFHGLNDKTNYYPLENKPSIFKIMDTIKLKESFYFNRQNSTKLLFHIYNVLHSKAKKGFELSGRQDLENFTLYLNDLLPQRF